MAVPITTAGSRGDSRCNPISKWPAQPGSGWAAFFPGNPFIATRKFPARQMEPDQRGTGDLAAQRLCLLETWSEVPDVRCTRSARSERDLRETECHHRSDAGADPAE